MNNFNSNVEPVKLDKDAIRDWVKTQCDPYKDTIPKIPDNVKNQVEAVYISFYEKLTQQKYDYSNGIVQRDLFLENYFENIHKNIVVIFGGSVSDMDHLMFFEPNLWHQPLGQQSATIDRAGFHEHHQNIARHFVPRLLGIDY